MIYPIVAFGDPILRKVAQPIAKQDLAKTATIVENMYETMYNATGIGLAAPQVGLGIRLFVVDGTPLNDSEEPDFENDPSLDDFKKAFINPQIIEESGDEWAFEEGCLSIPGIRADVYRPEKLTIKYIDLNGQEHIESYDGMAARIIQHEYDHLEGKLFTDHLPLLKRQMLKKKLGDITKGKVDTEYRMKFPK